MKCVRGVPPFPPSCFLNSRYMGSQHRSADKVKVNTDNNGKIHIGYSKGGRKEKQKGSK